MSTARRRLASGSRDGSIVIWALGSDGEGHPVGTARLDPLVSGLVWRMDGLALAALDASGGVTVYRVGK